MTNSVTEVHLDPESARGDDVGRRPAANSRRRKLVGLGILAVVAVSGIGCIAELRATASTIESELRSAEALVEPLRAHLAASEFREAREAVEQLRTHTATAKAAAGDPVWTIASTIPSLGENFSAVSEVAHSADDVANLGLVPLVQVLGALDWSSLVPNESGIDLEPLQDASPKVVKASQAVSVSADRLNRIDLSTLLPQIAEPLGRAREQLNGVAGTLDRVGDAALLVPNMMGTDGPRNYLLMIQNNSESRATGGIPGAFAVLTLNKGVLTFGAQASTTDLPVISPPIPTDAQQQEIYSSRMGKFIQDVNLTPDFPTAASTARVMWKQKTGNLVDGVISVDPIALGYILEATGPVSIRDPELLALTGGALPTELTADNVVPTLLSDVYAEIKSPLLQDAYFANVAQELFSSFSSSKASSRKLLEGMARGAEERRVLVWSGLASEQSVLKKYSISGSISGPSVLPAEFGVYFNDGTGAKMDYYVKRTVQLIKECPVDGYQQTTVRVTSTNNAPLDAATALPAYVTGGGMFDVPPGSVQTNIVAYGPVQANVETTKLNSQKTGFAPYIHDNRPVGMYTVRLAPGESKVVDFTFGKIVQYTEPNVVVTPTLQPVTDVTLPTISASCG